MRKLHYFSLALVLMLFACTKESGMENIPPQNEREGAVALTDAEQALYSLTSMLDDVALQTRMLSEQTVKQQTLINVSEIVDDGYSDVAGYNNAFYLVTLENENGVASTAFLGATSNLPSVIAIINGVEYTIEDCRRACADILGYEYIAEADDSTTRMTPGTTPTDDIIPPAVPPISTIIGTPFVPTDPTPPAEPDPEIPRPVIPNYPSELTSYTSTHYRDITKVGPLMKSHFHQGAPYNNKYEYKDKTEIERYAAGCVVIAIAQVMAYNKVELNEGPDDINGIPIDWENIEQAIIIQDNLYKSGVLDPINLYDDVINEALASFCDLIADEVVLLYRKNGTSSNLKQAKDLLEQCKYQNVNKQAFDSDVVKDMIVSKKRPVLIAGQKEGLIHGHAWVVDGWYQREKVEVTIVYQNGSPISSTTTVLGTEKYLHYNWGWETGQDGYYAEGVYNTQNVYLPTFTGEIETSDELEYDKLVKIVTYSSAQ